MVQEWDYKEFKRQFHQKLGLELERYKDKQMERRIRQMMARENKGTFNEFLQYLLSNDEARNRFMTYLTINTSEFFRDVKVYDALRNEILPELIKNFSSLTIWSAGCSIGAEPYTVAIILDQMGALKKTKIIATDIDVKALEVARKGEYHEKQLGKTEADVIKDYFNKDKEKFSVSDKIKKVIDFKRHNLFTDVVPASCHLILCRNVFIYFKPETQDFLLKKFTDKLYSKGNLIIGSAEYISNPENFKLTKLYPTIYRKDD